MVGSVVTKDMEENHVYAGVPARDMTEKLGPQFAEVAIDEKRAQMQGHLDEFLARKRPRENRIRLVDKLNPEQAHLSQFSLTERTYMKNLYPEEVAFMRFLLPRKAKFLPFSERDWVLQYLSVTPESDH